MTDPHSAPKLSGLPVLREALDADVMSRRLSPYMGDGAAREVSTARLVSYSWGKRAVVAYETSGRDGDGPALIGKAYADPERAHQLHRVLEELYAADAAGHQCGVPRPLAHLSDFGMSVYVAAPGCPLDRLEGRERREAMIDAARWLASLHGLRVRLDRRLDMANENANLVAWAKVVVHHHPRAAAATTQLLGRLDVLAAEMRVSTRVPIHKDFHYQHALFDHGRLVVIDLDEMRAGDPAFDVAHFGANLSLLALREDMPPGDLAGFESAFNDGYVSDTGYEREASYDFFYGYTCLKIAKQLVCGRGPTPVPTGAELWRQLDFILRQGLRCPHP